MLEKKLEHARETRKEYVHRLILFSILALITFILSILVLFIRDIREIYSASWLFFTLLIAGFILLVMFVIDSIVRLVTIRTEIYTILFKQSLPTEFCYDVTLKINSIRDIEFNHNVKKLRIRYVESRDSIECKYTLDKVKHHYFISLDLAEKFFECEFF